MKDFFLVKMTPESFFKNQIECMTKLIELTMNLTKVNEFIETNKSYPNQIDVLFFSFMLCKVELMDKDISTKSNQFKLLSSLAFLLILFTFILYS